jgi:hypothetical protein
MKKVAIILILTFNSVLLFPQVFLTIEGTEIVDTETGSWVGVIIPNGSPTKLTYRNNSVTSVNASGYMLCAGDEIPSSNNNNLDGAIITGNKFIWNGTDETSTTHAMFTGYNVDVILKYNYLYKVPNGIQRKSNGMTDGLGVIAYNILNNPKVGVVVKGMNGVKIYNNTLYSEENPAQNSRGLIDIHTNYDDGLSAVSTGTKIFNNIFYTKNKTLNIKIYETTCLQGFESDYNLFWCAAGEPVFEIAGVKKTFAEWQALGYDLHSVVLNPDFNNFTEFVPLKRLDHGKDLGDGMKLGLSVDAVWGKTDPKTKAQNGPWQVGARINESSEIKIYFNSDLNLLYVLMPESYPAYQAIKIYDLHGRVVLIDSLENVPISIPKSFATGIYIVSLESDNLDRYSRKLFIK